MNIKRFLIVIFVVAMSLSVVACDGKDGTNGVAGLTGPAGPPGSPDADVDPDLPGNPSLQDILDYMEASGTLVIGSFQHIDTEEKLEQVKAADFSHVYRSNSGNTLTVENAVLNCSFWFNGNPVVVTSACT